jgi:hypothetical protein
MLMAQGLGEYGALSGGASGMTNLFDNIEYALRDGGPGTWAAIAFGLLVIWFVFFRSH